MGFDYIIFFFFAAVAVIFALVVVLHRNPVVGALSLVASFFALAVMYVLLEAPFLAALQVIVYAGAIMVLFLFVVMLLNVPREEPAPPAMSALLGPTGMRFGVVLSVLLAAEVVWAISRIGINWFGREPSATSVSSVALIGNALFTRHAFAFEATSILILVAMVGAVLLAGKERH